jgi:protein-S-isoprenylcysteine O-methyltransferase Ste14
MVMSRSPAHERPGAFPWPPVLIAALLAAAWLLGRALPLPWPGLDDTPARLVGTGIGVAGVALVAWAVATLRRHRTTILPNKGADTLVTDGPYRYRRNPMYLGWVLVLLGLAELTKNLWLAAAAFAFAVLVTWLAIIPEEHHLEDKFADAYRDYKSSTRRWI